MDLGLMHNEWDSRSQIYHLWNEYLLVAARRAHQEDRQNADVVLSGSGEQRLPRATRSRSLSMGTVRRVWTDVRGGTRGG